MTNTTLGCAAGGVDARGAIRFFWVWLFAAASMSVAGNVTHAVVNASGGTVGLAAAAAVVPPTVLLGSTHSVALLVKTRRIGVLYWCALSMTVVLAGCAFVLSFDALRELAVTLGFRPGRAWLWPVAIGVSIAQSTVALLTLAPRTPAAVRPDSVGSASDSGGHRGSAPPLPCPTAPPPSPPRRNGHPRAGGPSGRAISATSESASAGGHTRSVAFDPSRTRPERPPEDGAFLHWEPTAHQLVNEGVTSKDPDTVAAILAAHAAGTPPSTIGRRHNVHHSTVGRILAAAQALSR